ncbi:DUF2242 domain-containing protein [Caballeronia sp. LZ019]|uniref:DUF2242 domain-containing protein n=1 Tax=Caballeronia sp. LZ019 TaxID=3038555 RepID=UPI00285E7048|nr:DUF2242 domain-containing protein [Caballeronia sp. LZ019]MDR5809835.1 DUF2242 domain-containing protein [Caballeronia sp. LZ019]
MPISSLRLAFVSLGLLALAACGGRAATTPSYQQELFSSGASPYAHNFDATVKETCEAARRALLSQGFLTTMAQPDTVDATKNFQPNAETHVVVSFHVVCTPGENTANQSIAYVNAVQDGYALKKSDTSASVGLSVLGSLSLPIRSNSDAMVKISSETVPAGKFYDRFFNLMGHYLRTVPRSSPVAADEVESKPLAPSLILTSPELTPTPIVVQAPAAAATAIQASDAAAETKRQAQAAATATANPVAASAADAASAVAH